jgi:hypothetical protein
VAKHSERVIIRANDKREIILLFPDLKHQGRMTSWNAQTGEHADGLPEEFRTTSGIQERMDSMKAEGDYERMYKVDLVRVGAP